METNEIKQRIKDYFVEIKEDKFTKVKSIKCIHKIEWKGKDLENKFMLTKNSYSNTLSMGIDYRHKDDVDSVFFGFTYSNSDGGYPGMTNIKMYLILDDDKTIELSEGSGFDHASQSSKVRDNYINIYIETAQLSVSMSDFIAIANAKKIEYSIRFGQGSLENTFSQNELLLFKGFYNAAFDDEFESSTIFENIKNKTISSTAKSSMSTKLQDYVKKYNILFDDLVEMSRIQSQVKTVSLTNYMANEKLKMEMWKYKSKYNIGFLDYGNFCNELKKSPVH